MSQWVSESMIQSMMRSCKPYSFSYSLSFGNDLCLCLVSDVLCWVLRKYDRKCHAVSGDQSQETGQEERLSPLSRWWEEAVQQDCVSFGFGLGWSFWWSRQPSSDSFGWFHAEHEICRTVGEGDVMCGSFVGGAGMTSKAVHSSHIAYDILTHIIHPGELTHGPVESGK